MTEAKNYGAVNVPKGNDEFDESNTRYLNEAPFQWGRFLRATVPIVVALLIMGGFAFGMSHGWVNCKVSFNAVVRWIVTNSRWLFAHVLCCVLHSSLRFNHLYGPPKGSDDENNNNIKKDSWIPEETPQKSFPTVNQGSKKCSKHSSCAELNLGGNCCPTDEGIMLECCG